MLKFCKKHLQTAILCCIFAVLYIVYKKSRKSIKPSVPRYHNAAHSNFIIEIAVCKLRICYLLLLL